MILTRSLLPIAVALLVNVAVASAESGTTGEWTVSRASLPQATAQIDFRSSDSDSGRGQSNSSFEIDLARLGLPAADLDSQGKHVQFTFAREAGSFLCEGWAGHGRGAGTFAFTPSASFVEGLHKRGFADLTAHKQLAAATLDITLTYVDGIAAAGFPHLPFDKLIAFRALGVTAESIAQLHSALGGGALSEDQVTSLAALRVTPTYISDMRSLGITDLSAQRVVELKALGIDRAYADGLAKAGYPHLSANNLVQMKALGIDQAYLQHLADHGLKNLTVSQLVQMKAVGI